ncbi:sensor histidine kinase [Allohahella sp. A8]|uniref:sensor histidine kinase n=1 Tax=Allohahella sp. A8 TaxID=3141461 RepID=UPI000C0AB33C|nr:PAS domain-containing sensor histidine kinase [Hahellaceae bacterium]|tara:strand:+ start:61705 stop:62880 length:1176 start_codon:yes stop_codon:yes gene_type:complete
MALQLAARQAGAESAPHFQQHASFSALLEILPAGVVILDSRGIIQEANPVAIEFLGEPLVGQRWSSIIDRSFAPRADDGHEVSLRDGRRVSVETRSLSQQVGQLILLTDMTETRRLQATISRDERLASMGRMVAALAHQIRTPLTAAMLYAGHLQRPELNDELRISCAGKLADRLNSLEQQVRDMLVFARGDRPAAERISADRFSDELVNGIASLPALIQRPGNNKTPVRVEFDNQVEDSALLVCNKDTLLGAIYNLVNNAVEACHKVAEPLVSVTLRVSEVAVAGKAGKSRRLEVLIVDNGQGFSAARGESIQEAFVSTKSHGTGLGLAVVRQVIQAHSGQFALASAGVNQGASAFIALPLNPAPVGQLSQEVDTVTADTNIRLFRGTSS